MRFSGFAVIVGTVAVGTVVIVACSDGDRPAASSGGTTSGGMSSGSGGPEAGPPQDAGPEAAGPEICANLTQLSQTHQEIQITDNPPAPTGGKILAGTYIINELNAYETSIDGGSDPPPPGPTGFIARSTLYVTETSMSFIESQGMEPAELPPDTVRGVSYRTEGTSLVTTPICPQPGAPSSVPFSVEGNLLTLHVAQKKRVVYLRKP